MRLFISKSVLEDSIQLLDKIMKLLLSVWAAMFVVTVNVYAEKVTIATQAELESINNNLSGSYVLANDIDLSGTTYTHSVIAFGSTAFTGTFDGGGFVIRNLNINSSNSNVGLFGKLGNGASVANLGIINAVVAADANAGILAGTAVESSFISNCYSTGTVTATGNCVGGLVGNASCSVAKSYSLADVSGLDYIGGIAGYNLSSGLISQAYSAGHITGTGALLGGLLGESTYTERKAVNFDGDADYIALSQPLPIFDSSFTIEMWVYFNDDGRGVLLGDYGLTNGVKINFERNTSGRLRIYWNNAPSFYTASNAVTINKWQHIAFQRDKTAGKFRIFVDGVLAPGGEYSSSIGDDCIATIPHYFGRDSRTGDTAFNGKMSDVRIWNYARTQAQIQSDMYQPLAGSELGLVGYWKFDEGSGLAINDSSASNNDGAYPQTSSITPDSVIDENTKNDGIINGPTFVSAADKYFGNAMNFDGADDFVSLSEPLPIFSGSFTIEMWAYFNDLERDIILGDYALSGGVNVSFEKYTSGRLRIYWNNAPNFVTSTNVVTTNTWYHIAFQRDKAAGKFRIFVNGVLASGGEYSSSIGTDYTATIPHYLGRDSRTTYTLNGKLADVRVWNYARTQAQIAADMGHLLGGDETGLLNNWQFNPDDTVSNILEWDSTDLLTDSVWDVNTSGMAASSGGLAKTTAQMQDVNTYKQMGWDFNDVWHFLNQGYPILSSQTKSADFTNDGIVDFEDLAILAADWTKQAVNASEKYIINPYQNINWTTVGQYKANLHTHTTQSDGTDAPATVIDAYNSYDYDILSLTDHDTVTYPWTTYGRDPAALGMLAIKGNEVSGGHHTLSYFSDYDAPSGTLTEAAIVGIGNNGGVAVFAHPIWTNQYPGGTRGLPTGQTWTLQQYARFFNEYDHLLGMEVYNHITNADAHRPVWDGVLSLVMPERNVWGFSNDDAHKAVSRGYSRNVFLLSEVTEQAVRDSMEDGTFYFAYSLTQNGSVPTINSINVDALTNTITIDASDYSDITWISQGNEVAAGQTFTLNNELRYVRAEITGSTGVAFTQPFTIINPCMTLREQGLNYPGDITGDCMIDINDFMEFANQWLEMVWN